MKIPALNRTNIMSGPPLPREDEALQGTLTVLCGGTIGQLFTLPAHEAVIGRSPQAAIQIDNDGVSRCHARIIPLGNDYLLEDLKSTNGTFVDGVRVAGPVLLKERSRIQVGTVLMQFGLQSRLQHEASRQMFEMATRDALTGLYNRRHFDERLASEFAFAVRHSSPLAIILIDIDHFKRVNDTWGHAAGDSALKHVATLLQKAVRAEDVVCRIGGEEMAVLVRGIPAPGCRALAERLRQTIEMATVPIAAPRSLRVTVSVGVAHNLHHVMNAAELLSSADASLYHAKRTGRNRVEGPVPTGWHGRQRPARRARVWEEATHRKTPLR